MATEDQIARAAEILGIEAAKLQSALGRIRAEEANYRLSRTRR